MHVRKAIRLLACVALMSGATLVNASAVVDRIIEVEAYQRVYEFVIRSLDQHGLDQTPYLNPSFQSQFRTVRDLEARSVMEFLQRYPDNRDALLAYVIALPEHLLSEAKRLRLLTAIAGFAPSPVPIPYTLGDQKITRPLVRGSSRSTSSVDVTPAQDINAQSQRPAATMSHEIYELEGRRERGFDFRFYRGLRFEYHFEAPVSLRFDVNRQRFGVDWTFD